MKDIENTTEEDFDSTYRLNVKGPYFLIQVCGIACSLHTLVQLTVIDLKKAVPHLGPGSHIVLLSTTQCHASTVTPNYLLYCSTKGE